MGGLARLACTHRKTCHTAATQAPGIGKIIGTPTQIHDPSVFLSQDARQGERREPESIFLF